MSDLTPDAGIGLLDRPQNGTGRDAEPPITAGVIRHRWDESVQAQRVQQVQYWLNRSQLYGDQYVQWNRTLNRVELMPRDDSRMQATVNKLWPATRSLMARLLRRELVFEVDPSEADDATIGASEVAESVLEATARDRKWEALRADHALATWLGGTGVLAVDWDPRAGVTLGAGADGRGFGTGDVVVSSLSVTEVGTEPGVRDIETARWWIRAQALPPRQVQEMFRMSKRPAADASAAVEPIGQRFASDGGLVITNLTLVLRYYERPSFLRPKGAVAVAVDGELVDGPHPWPFPFRDRLNCVAARETRVDGRWMGNTVFSAARSPQTLLNAAESSIGEHMKLAGNARLMLPDAALDGITDLTDLPAEIIPWSGQGEPPAWLAPPTMPSWWLEQPDRMDAAIKDILGVHDVTNGETPGDGQPASGTALGILSEHDEAPIAGLAKELAEAWGRCASLVLEVFAANVTEKRKAKVDIGTKLPLTVEWTGKDLAGQTTARVPLDEVLPRSKAAALQQTIQLAQAGVIPPGNTRLFAQLADLNLDDLWEGLDTNVAKARRENLLLSIGRAPMPAHFDDHAKHIDEHNRQRMSARYERSSPALQKLIDNHVTAHEVMAAEAAGQLAVAGAAHPAFAGAPMAHQPAPLAAAPTSAPGSAPVDADGDVDAGMSGATTSPPVGQEGVV